MIYRIARAGILLAAVFLTAAVPVDNLPSFSDTKGGNVHDSGMNVANIRPGVATTAALQLAKTTSFPNGVWRDDYSAGFGAPPLFFKPGTVACTLNSGVGDGASQVPSADGKCWLGQLKAPYDARWWGVSYPFTVNVTATGDDNGYCFVIACSTTQRAVNVAGLLDFKGQQNFLTIGNGTFPGWIASGPWFGGAGPNISGAYLIITGQGSGNTTITTPVSAVANIIASTQAAIIIDKFSCVVSSAAACLFAQNAGTYVGVPGSSDLKIIGNNANEYGFHVEALAELELTTGANVTFQGTLGYAFAIGQLGYVEIDPGTGGNHVTLGVGSGLTASYWFLLQDMSHVNIGTSATIAQLTGNFAALQRGSVLSNGSASVTVAGSSSGGTVNIDYSSTYLNILALTPTGPTAGCGTAPAIAGGDRAGKITIGTTPSTSCAYTFSAPYSNVMVCFASDATALARNPVFAGQAGAGFQITPFGGGSFTAGDVINYNCVPGQ